MVIRPLLPVLAALLLLGTSPTVARAQNRYDQTERPTDIDYSPLYLARPDCWTLSPNNFPYQGDCFSDPTEEDRSRQEANQMKRWLRAGLLSVAQIWWGVEQIKNSLDATKRWYGDLKRAIAGYDSRGFARTVYRVSGATDRYVDRMNQGDYLSQAWQLPGLSDRHNWVAILGNRALATAMDGQDAAYRMGESAVQMRARLDPYGNLTVSTVGVRERGERNLPTSEVEYADPFMDPDLADAVTAYQRAAVQASGALAASDGTTTDLRLNRDMIRALRAQESENAREAVWLGRVSSTSSN